MKKLFVFHHTDAFMSAIIDQVRNGYTRYAMGTVAPDKVGSMAAKMAMFYKTDADRNERFRMKQNKLAPARLLIRERKSQTELQWILLVYGEGESPAVVGEKLRSVRGRDSRLTIDDFELVKRIDMQSRANGKGPHKKPVSRWTWKIASRTDQTIRDRIVEAVRTHNQKELHIIQLELWNMPGFATIRHQIGKATALARAEWERKHKSTEEWPGWPAKLAYIRKKKPEQVGQYWQAPK